MNKRACVRMKPKRRFHVKRLERFDQLIAEASGRCRSATKRARQLTLIVTLATSAMAATGCDMATGARRIGCDNWISACAKQRPYDDCIADVVKLYPWCKP